MDLNIMSEDIEEFLKENKVPDSFDENFYMERYEKVSSYYEPYCSENGITDKQRLYHHYIHYGQQMGFQPHPRKQIKQYAEFDQDILNEPISLVVGCKDRENMLSVSLRSWILHDIIKEIIIVDWGSKKSLKHLEDVDTRIRVIRVEEQEYYNASKPINMAIKAAKYDKILKMDVDYILNPYLPLASLIDIKEGEFVAGDWRQRHFDNHLGFIQNLNGIICCYRDLFIKAGLYNEKINNYGREDCEMFERLQNAGGIRKHIEFAKDHVPVYHNPHNVKVRGRNREDPDVISTMMYFEKKFGTKNFDLIINLYRDEDENRRNEILNCLELNLKNKYIEHVHIFLENYDDFPEFYSIPQDNITVINVDKRVSFRKIFDYCNENIANKQCLVANNDILFTNDLGKIRGVKPHDFIALTRHEGDKLIKNTNREAFCSQDAWIFTSPMVDDLADIKDDTIIGTFFSDNIINYMLYRGHQYNAWNICKDIKIIHMHQHGIPDHEKYTKREGEAIKNEYCNKYGDDEFLQMLVATDIEDYYQSEKSNYFITWADFELNDYKY